MDSRADRVERAYNLHLVDSLDPDMSESGFPILDAADANPARLVAFTERGRGADPSAGVHFFLDDYRFDAVWRDPLRYAPQLSGFACALTPDWSVYLEMPEPMQRWGVYRSRAVGRIWQDAGVAVVPTLRWGEPATFGWCFEGLPRGSTVALSTVGLADCPEGRELFRLGAEEAMRRLRPRRVIAHGREVGFDPMGAEVVWHGSGTQERFAAIRAAKRAAREGKVGSWAEEA